MFSFGYGNIEAEPGDIIITEIFTRSEGNIPDYIEVYNRSLFSHSLFGWKISIYGTEYSLDHDDSVDELNLSPFHYLIITGRDGYFMDENSQLHIAAGDERIEPESEEYNSEFASFYANIGEYEEIENAVWAPFALSHSASEIELINDNNVVIDVLEYNSDDYQIGGNFIGHSIELTNDIPQGLVAFDPIVGHSPEYWEYSKHSRPFMFSSNELYGTDNLFMEFGSPGKRNYLNSVITVTNLQCGPDPVGSEFCNTPGALCVSQNDDYNDYNVCLNYHGEDNFGDFWEFFDNSQTGLCWYECAWSDTIDYNNMNINNPIYNIYHDRIPGGTKSLIFEADQSSSHEGDDITSYKWYKNGNVFQNGISMESEFAEGSHELVLLVKNEDDIWAVDTFNFEIKEPNKEPSPIISVDATEYVVAHNGDPAPAATGITLSGVNSCDCNDYIRYEFLRNGIIINDENYDCSCEPTAENPTDWVGYLTDKCENLYQVECEDEEYSEYCWWNPDGEDSLPETSGACEYSEIEYFFWTENGEIQGTSKEFVSYVPDIGDYVYSLILTDTYGENNSASTEITIKKELNYPPKANIVGETTIPNFTNSNGIPYDTGILDLDQFDESYDVQLSEGQNSDDIIFSQWYSIDGEAINADDTDGDAHEVELGLGTYTFILEVTDSYNCYSKNNYGNYLNICGNEPCVDVCYEIESESECTLGYSGCRWYENTCTPYCELYAQGFCDGFGGVPNDTPCHVSGVNVAECGVGGSCIFNDEYCSTYNNENYCRCGDEGIWDSDLQTCTSGEKNEYCNWNINENLANGGTCIGDLQSANYDTLTVILSEENSPPIADIGTHLFEYMEEEPAEIIPSVYDIEFYNLSGHRRCLSIDVEEEEICDPTIPPIFDSADEKCCVQSQWEVIASHFGKDPDDYIDFDGDGIDDDWYFCTEEDLTHPYCSGNWLLTPNEDTLRFTPPENIDFYPDSVKLRLTATDPFYNSGYSELFGQDEVIIIIENNNQPPHQSQPFDEGGYIIIEDDNSTFIDIDLTEKFEDDDGEILDFNYFIPNNQLIDEEAIELDENGYILEGNLRLQNIQDKNGDVEVYVYAMDSEYTIQASFTVSIIPNNDIPNIYSVQDTIFECIINCDIEDAINGQPFELEGDPGGCGENNNPANCEDGNLSYEITRSPYFGLVESNEFGLFYYPYEDFFGYDTVFFQITDIGSSAGIVDTLMSEIGHIVFYVKKSDNNEPVVQRTNFTIKEDFLIHFTVSDDSLTYIDSLNHVYVGLDILDDDNNCLADFNSTCNDSLFNIDSLKVYVQSSSGNNEFFTITDTNLSVIQIDENYNNSLVVPIRVRDHEYELGNFESDEYEININLIPVNDKPIAENSLHQFLEDETLEFELIGDDYEGNSLSYEIIKLPTKLDSIFPYSQDSENILFEFGETPFVRYTPLKDYNGLDSLVYLIHDDGTTNGEPDSLTSDSIIVWFDIQQVNDPPRIDTIYFESDTLISSLKEDTSNVKVFMVYTDIDSDEDLNQNVEGQSDFDLIWEFNTSDNESGLKFWFIDEPPTVEEFYQNPLRRLGSFTIDSLLANWNGTDTSIIKITDVDGLVENYKFGLTVEAVNDPPDISSIRIDTSAIDTLDLWEYYYDDEAEVVIIAEDSKNVPLLIEYFDIDTDSTLNANPDTIAGFSWDLSSVKNKLSASHQVVFSEELGTDVFKFTIDSISDNWNGYDTLVTVITDTIGDSFYHNMGLQIYQVNDRPEPFNYFSQLNQYPFNSESNYFYEDNNSWTFRLPYQEDAISEENPDELLIKWKRTSDIDLVDSLNNHENRIIDLFYRIELTGDRSGYTYVLKSRINDSLFNQIDFCAEDLEVTPEECLNLGIIDSTFGFTKIDLTKSFLTYKGAYYDSLNAPIDTVYKKLDLTNNKNYYCGDGSGPYGPTEDYCINICPESCANTDYRLNVVAYNASREGDPDEDDFGYDFQSIDSPQYADVFDGDSANFNVDLTLPDFQFNVIRNDIFWEYYDLYITNSESILNSISGENYNPLLLIEYQNGVIDTITTTSSEHGPIHYTSQFQSEDSITFIYSARDLVENYGVSSKTISYAIVEPMEKSIAITPSQNSQITFEIGSVSEITGIIAQDIEISSDFINGIGVSFLPENQPIISNVKLSFNLDLIDLPNGNSWNYELYKRVNGNWENLNVRFQKLNGFIHTDINELGEFIVLYNEDAVKPIPTKFVMYPNYPNPFNGTTTIRFELPKEELVRLNIINILGENVRTIYSGKLTADFHSYNWDGLDSQLNSVASGVYFVQLYYNNKKHLQKIMYMK